MKFRAQDAILILISAIFSLAFFPPKWALVVFILLMLVAVGLKYWSERKQ